MAQLDIRAVVIKPTLAAVVEFEPAGEAPIRYRVAAVQGGDAPVVAYGTTEIITLPGPLKYGKNYSFSVTAEYPDNQEIAGAATVQSTDIETSLEEIVRQKLYDILAGAGIEIGGRPLRFFADKYGQPASMLTENAVSKSPPVVEIELPVSRQDLAGTAARRIEMLECPIQMIDSAQDPDSGFRRLAILYAMIRAAINGTRNLGLPGFGVVDQSWSWRADDPVIEGKLVGLEATLIVPFPNQTVGALPYRD